MSHLSSIYAVWGDNAEAMAADINERGVTVRQWRNRRSIPPQYWQKIVAAAAKRGATIPLSAFLPEQPSPANTADLSPFPARSGGKIDAVAA